MVRADKIRCFACCVVGVIVSTGHPVALACAVAFPQLVRRQGTWFAALVATFAYYLGALWPISPAATNFSIPHGNLLWLAAAVLHSIPGLGLLFYASPLMAAGLLFPGLGWFGLGLTLAACFLRDWRKLLILASVAIVANAVCREPAPPEGWIGVDTDFGSLQSPVDQYRAASEIQRLALTTDARIMVFPEGVVPWWSDGTAIFWEDAISTLKAQRKTILIGTRQGGDRYKNELLGLGSVEAEFVQSLPVPLAMWRPGEGAALAWPESGQLASHRVSILICHEQLLAVSLFRVLGERPAVLIGASNDHWVKDTPIPRWRDTALRSIARLAKASIIAVTNR